MEAVEAFKPLGWMSVALLWVAIAILVYRWRGDKSMSISKHAAAHKNAYLMMLAIQSLVFPAYILFAVKWLTPTLELPFIFNVLTVTSFSCFYLAACVPDKDGWQGRFHSFVAYGASILLIPCLTILYLSPNISDFARSVTLFTLIYQMFALTYFIAFDRSRSRHLYFQAAYFLLYDLTALAVAYTT